MRGRWWQHEGGRKTPPSRTWMRGRWWQHEGGRNHLRLAIGCEGGGGSAKGFESHLRLALGCEGGGGRSKTTSVSQLDAREVAAAQTGSKPPPSRNWMRGRWRQCEGV